VNQNSFAHKAQGIVEEDSIQGAQEHRHNRNLVTFTGPWKEGPQSLKPLDI
jgi:hypothetical protein